MSYDLAAFSGSQELGADEAASLYQRLCAGDDTEDALPADDRIAAFVRAITDRWPQPDDVPDDEVDDCPWSTAFNVSPRHILSPIVRPRAEEVAPIYVRTALEHGLHVFDPQAGVLHSPGRPPRPAASPPRASRTCAGCGREIEPTETMAGKHGEDAAYHIRCVVGAFTRTS